MITISRKASDQIKSMLAEEGDPNMFLRIGVDEGGCTGFSYGIAFDHEKKETDSELEVSGLKVLVDHESKKYLYGVQIGFRESAMGGGFTIENPNASVTCGCGASFRTPIEEGKPDEDC